VARVVQNRPAVHERWAFEKRSRKRTLRRLICVCATCRTVTHAGPAQLGGPASQTVAALIEVTGARRTRLALR
jgi:hypothetical protein